jgi:hypothetical protein
MVLVRTLPGLGSLPQLDTFRCTGCGEVQTVSRK